MVIIEPFPRGDTAVIVVHDPLETLAVTIHELLHGRRIPRLEFELTLWIKVSRGGEGRGAGDTAYPVVVLFPSIYALL